MRYEAPKTLEQAIALLSGANGQGRVLAGGTDVLIQLRSGRADPQLLVDVKAIPEMRAVVADSGGYRIGAAVTCMELIENEAFARDWPGVVDGVKLIGSIQVKGRATMGGNLCNASPAADSVPALIAAGALVCIAGPLGRREAPVEDFVLGPGRTSLGNGELVASIQLPRRAPHSGDAYLRFTPRTEMDIAVVGAGGQSDAGRQRRMPQRAGRPRRGRRARLAGAGGRGRADRHHGRRSGAGTLGRGRERGLPADRRQARHQGIPHQGRGRDGAARGRDRDGAGEEAGLMSRNHVSATVNGDQVEFLCETGQTLLEVLRDELRLTGTKEGCGTGDCGACSVIVDGRLVCACLMLAVEAEGKAIQTIEGMAVGEALHPLQRKFIEHAALQCGICTPGILIAARSLLERNPNPTEDEVRYWLAGNLCRCTGYHKIVDAVLDAAREMRGG